MYNLHRVRDFGALSHKRDDFIKPLPSGFRYLCRRGNSKEIVSSYTVGLMYTSIHGDCGSIHETCTGLSQIGSQHWGPGEWITKKLFELIPAGKWQISFIQWSVTGCINHTPGQASSPVIDLHKTKSMDLELLGVLGERDFYFVLFCFGFFFCLMVLCLF